MAKKRELNERKRFRLSDLRAWAGLEYRGACRYARKLQAALAAGRPVAAG
jgi:hypothetical protein